jgi:hypothetical protein
MKVMGHEFVVGDLALALLESSHLQNIYFS